MEVQKYGVTQRYVEETDTEFILSLRTNKKLGKFLSPTMNDIQQQKKWIKAYKIRESNKEDFYFITLDEFGNKLGLTRIYNFDQDLFEFGSWIFAKNSQI